MVQTRAMITPSKRARTSGTRSFGTQTPAGTTINIYRGSKPETKILDTNISHSISTDSTTIFNTIVQGSASNQRSGSKVKVTHLSGMVRSSGDLSMRLTIYAPKTASDTLAAGLTAPVSKEQYWVLKDFWLHAGTENNNRGHFFNIKLPMGVNVDYNSADGTVIKRNRLMLLIQTTTSDTVGGYVRCHYIDP